MSSIAATLLSALILLSTPEVHLAAFDSPMAPGKPSGDGSVELTAAGDEREHFYVRIINDESRHVLHTCETVWRNGVDAPATFYRVEPRPTDDSIEGGADGTLVPLPYDFPLDPGAVVDLLVSVHISPVATPGAHSGELRLVFDDKRTLRCPLSLNIFAFSLPAAPSLPVLFGLNQRAISAMAGLSVDLDDWAPVYDTFAGLRAGYSSWPRRTPAEEVFYDYSDLDLIKEHLAYAVRTADLPAIEIGGAPGELLAGWPPPVGNAPQDPLQLLLVNLTSHLQQLGWTRPTALIPEPVGDRSTWPDVRKAFARVDRADRLISRVLPGPIHPFFERYTDIWALPAGTSPAAMSLLNRGLSIVRYAQPALAEITGTAGSSDDAGIYTTAAGDALDGCEYTLWRVAPAPAEGGTAQLTATFEQIQHLEQIAVIWPPDTQPAAIRVDTAYNPGSFSEATVRWEESGRLSEGEQDISLGTFKHPRDSRAIRMQFQPSPGSTVAVAEILFNQDARTVVNISIEDVAPWLNLRTLPSPFLTPESTGAALHLLPWFCWQRNFRGVLGPELGVDPVIDPLRLIASGPAGVQASVRMLHLLDGIEDYEYLRQYWQALRNGSIAPPENFRPGWITLPPTTNNRDEVLHTLAGIREERLKMGRLLSGQTLVTRNFGP